MKQTLAVLIPLLALMVAGDAVASELVLAPEFRLNDLRQMPASSAQVGLGFEKRDYPDENAIEWQVRIRAPAEGGLPLYEDVKSAEFVTQFPYENDVTLHWSRGSHAVETDFQPRVEKMTTGKPFTLESCGGRSSDGVMPYFNLASAEGGLILAIGWPGDWKASFEALGGGKLKITAGLKRSRFKLRVGEEVRLPSVLVMGYRGEWTRGQNQFRRLMLRHFTPTSHPPMELMPVAASVHGMLGFNATTEENLTALAADIAALKLPLDTFWLDAGWNEGGFPAAQGNPDADPVRFPHGLGPVGKAANKGGMCFLMWFEPERAMRGTWLEREHSGWLSSPSGTPPELRYMENDGFRLVNLDNAEARQWALDSVSRHIREADVTVYRQDFNEYPSYFWHTDEPPDEVGLREVRYINGLYNFLDELAQRHPGLIIDNCASGGRRLDFEMMRRSVVLWRSDSCWDAKSFPRNMQAMTHGLSYWIPLHGVGALTTDDVALRSGMGACASYAVNYRDPNAVAALRKHLDRYLSVRPNYAADFYPLTDWSDDPTKWLAFQFHDPKTGKGIVQAFCGANVTERSYTLKLRGLVGKGIYRIKDWEKATATIAKSGLELGTSGIEVHAAKEGNTAIVLEYGASP